MRLSKTNKATRAHLNVLNPVPTGDGHGHLPLAPPADLLRCTEW